MSPLHKIALVPIVSETQRSDGQAGCREEERTMLKDGQVAVMPAASCCAAL